MMVFPLRLKVTLRMIGAPREIGAEMLGAGFGVMSIPPASRRNDTVSVPETVPVCTAIGVSLVVLPVGIVKFAVVPPDAN